MSAPIQAGTACADFRHKLFPDGVIETKRLILAPLEPSDAFTLVILTNDPLVAHGSSTLPQPFTLDDARALIALPRDGGGCFAAVRLRDGKQTIGCAGVLIHDRARGLDDLELGFWLGAPHHGHHYGAEAAEAMLLAAHAAFPKSRIVVECPRVNGASWRLLRRLGFEPGAGRGVRQNAELLAWRAEEAVAEAR
jgi:RimJ/RimL family protein N-acetyltransferase